MSDETNKIESREFDPTQPPAHWKVRYLLWIGAFVFIIYVFEMSFRESILSQTFGYEKTVAVAGNRYVSFIFTGTSRTLHAVDEDLIMNKVGKELGRDWYGRNLSGGGNKIDNHYLGLRNLFRENPEYLQNTIVFIETPDELPEHMYWSDSWTFDDYKRNLIPNLRLEDMLPLFKSSTKLNTKLHLMINFLLYDWRSFESRYVLRHEFLAARSRDLAAWMEKIGGRAPKEEVIENIDENLGRNVKVDKEVLRNADVMLEQFIARNQEILFRPWDDWEDTVIDDIVDVVQSHGGQVVFFDVPQHSNYNGIYYEYETRDNDRKAFREYLKKKGCIYIKADFNYTDSDFPDKFHLGQTQSKPYSEALADQIIEKVLKKKNGAD